MKYPIDINDIVREFNDTYPDNPHGEVVFRTFLSWVNEAYTQGVEDGRKGTAV